MANTVSRRLAEIGMPPLVLVKATQLIHETWPQINERTTAFNFQGMVYRCPVATDTGVFTVGYWLETIGFEVEQDDWRHTFFLCAAYLPIPDQLCISNLGYGTHSIEKPVND